MPGDCGEGMPLPGKVGVPGPGGGMGIAMGGCVLEGGCWASGLTCSPIAETVVVRKATTIEAKMKNFKTLSSLVDVLSPLPAGHYV